MKTKILITGCSGFIGSHIIESANNNQFDILGVDKKKCNRKQSNFSFIKCDICDLKSLLKILRNYKPECVIHLAARTDLNGLSLSDYETNIRGVENLVNAIRNTASVKRAIYTSTQLVCKIGYQPNNDRDYRPNTLYGKSKMIGEKIVRKKNGGCQEWCIVRPTTIWGSGMSQHYQKYFRAIQRGYYFHVGKNKLYKSYGYVKNTAYQYLQLMTAKKDLIHSKVFYLADYNPISLREFSNAFQKELGATRIKTIPKTFAKLFAIIGDQITKNIFKSFPFSTFRLNNILTEYQFDMTETRCVCGHLPYSVSEGIQHTAEWLRMLEY